MLFLSNLKKLRFVQIVSRRFKPKLVDFDRDWLKKVYLKMASSRKKVNAFLRIELTPNRTFFKVSFRTEVFRISETIFYSVSKLPFLMNLRINEFYYWL